MRSFDIERALCAAFVSFAVIGVGVSMLMLMGWIPENEQGPARVEDSGPSPSRSGVCRPGDSGIGVAERMGFLTVSASTVGVETSSEDVGGTPKTIDASLRPLRGLVTDDVLLSVSAAMSEPVSPWGVSAETTRNRRVSEVLASSTMTDAERRSWIRRYNREYREQVDAAVRLFDPGWIGWEESERRVLEERAAQLREKHRETLRSLNSRGPGR